MMRWTAADIPDQTGKTAFVTGANSGIGFHTALELARAGARVVVAVRDEVKGKDAIRRLQAEVPDANLHWVCWTLPTWAQCIASLPRSWTVPAARTCS
jgi:NAD(P)-dependent dehydrogenase (short-subunit alcohol dehydrogenase family)